MLYFTAYSLISDVSGTIRQCHTDETDVSRCTTQGISLPARGNKKVESQYGQNKVCNCFGDLCNNSPWLEWSKPTTRRRTTRRHTTQRPITRKQAVVTTESLHPTNQHDVTWYSSDTPTDPEGVPLPTDSDGVPLPTDSEGVPLIEKSMSTQSMDHTLPAGYNDHSTDKIQSNGVKALNDDMVFVTLLTLLLYIFW